MRRKLGETVPRSLQVGTTGARPAVGRVRGARDGDLGVAIVATDAGRTLKIHWRVGGLSLGAFLAIRTLRTEKAEYSRAKLFFEFPAVSSLSDSWPRMRKGAQSPQILKKLWTTIVRNWRFFSQ